MKLKYIASGLLRLCSLSLSSFNKALATIGALDWSLTKGEIWFRVMEVDYKC